MNVFDLHYGRKLYDWWGKHPVLYRLGSWLVFLGRENSLRNKGVSFIGLKEGDIVLDLACGNGVNFEYLEKRIGEQGQIIGFDYSEGMLRFATERKKKNNWQNIQLLQGDAASLDLQLDSLDGAFCSLGLSAIPDIKSTIQNVYNSLKPEKHFVVLDAKLFDGWTRVFNPIIRPLFKYSTNWNYNKDIPKTLREIFGTVKSYRFNGGSIFILDAKKTIKNNG